MKITARFVSVLAALSLLPLLQSAKGDGPDDRMPVASRTDLYCTGYISDLPPTKDIQVIGGERENYQYTFSTGNVVYLNRGREDGIQSGAVYYIIRPVGEVRHPFKKKKKVGTLVRELGMLRVIEVQASTSTAEIILACDSIHFGDLLRPYEEIVSPAPRDVQPLPRYAESSGGITGQIIMSPQYREFLAANQVVYLDLGKKDGLQPGDYFTIYRKIGSNERIAHMKEYNVVDKHNRDYQSDQYRGGEISNGATRKFRQKVVDDREKLPRKVMGELVILRVENSTAVAMITRTIAEVNIGDHVEKSN
ncbi:MAG: hypothetical protein AB1631_12450 [Acidobacteriota bacterium]